MRKNMLTIGEEYEKLMKWKNKPKKGRGRVR